MLTSVRKTTHRKARAIEQEGNVALLKIPQFLSQDIAKYIYMVTKHNHTTSLAVIVIRTSISVLELAPSEPHIGTVNIIGV